MLHGLGGSREPAGDRNAGEAGEQTEAPGCKPGDKAQKRLQRGADGELRREGGEQELPAMQVVEMSEVVIGCVPGVELPGGKRGGVEREAHAIAGERRNHNGLIAERPKGGCGGAVAEQAVRDFGEGQRLGQEGFSVGEAGAEVRRCGEDGRKEGGPGVADGAQEALLHKQAEVGAGTEGIRLDGLQAGVAVGKEDELNGLTEGGLLGGRQAEVELEGDQRAVPAGRAGMAAEVVLARGQNDLPAGELLAVCEAEPPGIGWRGWLVERLDAVPTHKMHARLGGGLLEQGFIKREAGKRGGGKRQGHLREVSACSEAQCGERQGAQGSEVETEIAKIGEGLGGEEVATDLVSWRGMLLHQRDRVAVACEMNSCGGASQTTTNDGDIRVSPA